MGTGMFHAADAYDRLMGRFLPALAPAFADFAGVHEGAALDVGCGPGGLTSELARRLGAAQVTAIDPSTPFVLACRERVPGATVVEGTAEELPFDDRSFDAALSSLAVGFMTDAGQGVREMARVTAPGGVVALCFWDRRRMPVIGRFWQAASRALDVEPNDESLLGSHSGDIADLLEAADLTGIRSTELLCSAEYADADDLWSGYTGRIGPIGQYLQTLSDTEIESIRIAVREDLDDPDRPFVLSAVAWGACGTAG